MKNNSLLKKFLSFSIGSWIGIGISVLSTPILTRLFSPEEFAKASMFDLAINIILLTTMVGSDQAFVRFFYEEKEENRKYLLRNCLNISLLIWIVISIINFIFYKKISFLLFNIESKNSVILIIVTSLIFLLYRFSSLQIRMEQRGKVYSIMEVTLRISELGFMVLIFFIIGNRFEAINMGRALSILIVAMIGIISTKKNWIFKNEKKDLINDNYKIISFGLPLLFTSLIMWLFQSSSRFAIKEYLTMRDLGIFAGAYKIIGIFSIVQSSFSTYWAPLSYEKYETDKNDFSFFEKMFNIIFFLMIFLGVLIIMFKGLIVLLLGENYRAASKIIPFLVFSPIMVTMSEISKVGISFSKKIKWSTFNSAITCIINLILNYSLVAYMGLKGASIATGLSYIILFYLNTIIGEKLYGARFLNKHINFSLTVLIFYALIGSYIKESLSFYLGIIVLAIIYLLNKKKIRELLINIKNRRINEKI